MPPARQLECEVAEVRLGSTYRLCHVTVGTETFSVTLYHRSFVEDAEIPAADLRPGDPLINTGPLHGAHPGVRREQAAGEATFNPRIASLSTYFVGNAYAGLVHNDALRLRPRGLLVNAATPAGGT